MKPCKSDGRRVMTLTEFMDKRYKNREDEDAIARCKNCKEGDKE